MNRSSSTDSKLNFVMWYLPQPDIQIQNHMTELDGPLGKMDCVILYMKELKLREVKQLSQDNMVK